MLTTTLALLWTVMLAQGAALPPAVYVGASDVERTVANSTANNILDSKITETPILGGIVRVNVIYRRNLEQAPLVHEQLTEIYQIDADFKAKVDREFDAMLTRAGGVSTKVHT